MCIHIPQEFLGRIKLNLPHSGYCFKVVSQIGPFGSIPPYNKTYYTPIFMDFSYINIWKKYPYCFHYPTKPGVFYAANKFGVPFDKRDVDYGFHVFFNYKDTIKYMDYIRKHYIFLARKNKLDFLRVARMEYKEPIEFGFTELFSINKSIPTFTTFRIRLDEVLYP